jgi:hypothetical protein
MNVQCMKSNLPPVCLHLARNWLLVFLLAFSVNRSLGSNRRDVATRHADSSRG